MKCRDCAHMDHKQGECRAPLPLTAFDNMEGAGFCRCVNPDRDPGQCEAFAPTAASVVRYARRAHFVESLARVNYALLQQAEAAARVAVAETKRIKDGIKKLARYDCSAGTHTDGALEVDRWPDGEWVKWDDLCALLDGGGE